METDLIEAWGGSTPHFHQYLMKSCSNGYAIAEKTQTFYAYCNNAVHKLSPHGTVNCVFKNRVGGPVHSIEDVCHEFKLQWRSNTFTEGFVIKADGVKAIRQEYDKLTSYMDAVDLKNSSNDTLEKRMGFWELYYRGTLGKGGFPKEAALTQPLSVLYDNLKDLYILEEFLIKYETELLNA